jgi:Tol biopolymer transport system component
MFRSLTLSAVLVVLSAGCTGTGTVPSVAPGRSSGATPSVSSPTAVTSAPATATPVAVPAGRILFERVGSDEVERYFTMNIDGSDEQALFTTEGCGCARWSTDGTQIWTMGATGHGTWSFTTMRPDGSGRSVISPPIKTLNLGPAMPSADGRWIAFDGWDDKDPSRNGLYVGSAGLADLRLVTPLPKGTAHVDPFGVTPDGSHVLFMAERADEPHEVGDLYVVDSGRGKLRKVNPPDTTLSLEAMPASLSPDGRQAVFGVDDALFVIDIDGGEARQISNRGGYVWAVSWSPTGEWIAYTRQHGMTSLISLVRPDGTDPKEISPNDETDEAAAGAWSPDGTYLLVQRDSDTTLDGPRDLWIMDLEGHYIGQVTHQPSTYELYSWANNGG